MAIPSRTLSRRAEVSEIALHLRKLGPLGWVAEIAKYLVLVALALSFLLPFIWMFTSALKDSSQIFTVPPKWIPNPALWENF